MKPASHSRSSTASLGDKTAATEVVHTGDGGAHCVTVIRKEKDAVTARPWSPIGLAGQYDGSLCAITEEFHFSLGWLSQQIVAVGLEGHQHRERGLSLRLLTEGAPR